MNRFWAKLVTDAWTMNSNNHEFIGCLLVGEQKAQYFVSVEEVVTIISTKKCFMFAINTLGQYRKLVQWKLLKKSSHAFQVNFECNIFWYLYIVLTSFYQQCRSAF